MAEQKKILIIDDEPDILTYFETIFMDHGYGTLTSDDGLDGYKQAQKFRPDLICLDITMPGQSGIKTFQQIRNDPDINKTPVIIITAHDPDTHPFLAEADESLQPEGFVIKPINPEALMEMVLNLLST